MLRTARGSTLIFFGRCDLRVNAPRGSGTIFWTTQWRYDLRVNEDAALGRARQFKCIFLDDKSGTANCALIFWTTEAVEQFCRHHPRRHSQRPKAFVEDNVVAPKRKPCRAIFSDEQRGPCHYLYDDAMQWGRLVCSANCYQRGRRASDVWRPRFA